MPPLAMIDHLGPDLDQSLDDPRDRTLDTFADDVERPEHMEEIVGDDAHQETSLVGFEPVTADRQSLAPSEPLP